MKLSNIVSKFIRAFRIALSDPTKLYRFYLKCVRQGFSKTFKDFFFISFTEYENEFDLKIKSFTVLTTPHCHIIAQQLKFLLEKIGFACQITYDEDELLSNSSKSIPLVLAPQMFSKLPKKFIAFQLEQKGSSWFTEEYLSILRRATFVLEFSQDNLEFLQRNGINFEKLYYCPIFPNSFSLPLKYTEIKDKNYDLVFYGAINSRRKRILYELSKKFKILILSDVFGEKLYRELLKARILLNIHFYEDAHLETTRLIEARALGLNVVSEASSTQKIDKMFSSFVTFAENGNISDLCSKIHEQLLVDDSDRSDNSSNEQTFSWFDFYFLRFMLAQDQLSFDSFSSFFLKSFPKIDTKICLNLPESIERRKKFESQPYSSHFCLFPGLRHSLGWLGCGYSYKFLFLLASLNEVQQLNICEDDVVFPNDMEERIRVIENFLKLYPGKWSVFTGLISDVTMDTKITSVILYENTKFIFTNSAVGLVFSIFSKEAIFTLSQWEKSGDVTNNTIDRYMKKNINNYITSLPFLVVQDDDLTSTIWGGENGDIYGDYLKISLSRLQAKVKDFENSHQITLIKPKDNI